MMGSFIQIRRIFLLLLLYSSLYAHFPFTNHFASGKELADAYQKPLVLVFTGSDWSAPCQRLLKEIFTSPKWQETIRKDCIFVWVDFPELNTQPLSILKQNQKLKEQFSIHSFPTMLVLSGEEEVTRYGFLEMSPEEIALRIKQDIFTYQKLTFFIASDLPSCKDQKMLEDAYYKAKELGNSDICAKILQHNLKYEVSIPLLIEQYHCYINQNKMQQGNQLATKILDKDDSNCYGFQEVLVRTKAKIIHVDTIECLTELLLQKREEIKHKNVPLSRPPFKTCASVF